MRQILLFFVFCIFAFFASINTTLGQVQVGSVLDKTPNNVSGSSATLSNVTVPAGSNRILILYIGWNYSDGDTPTLNSVTFDGSNMTAVGAAVSADGGDKNAQAYYTLLGTSGSNSVGDVVVNFSGSFSSAGNFRIHAIDYSNVDQNAPSNYSSASGTTSTASLTVTSTVGSGNLVVDLGMSDIKNFAEEAGQTRWIRTTDIQHKQFLSYESSAAGSTLMSWTTTVNDNWGQLGFELISSSVLPVELIAFTAKAEDDRVILNWQTASEINNEGFEIEHSLTGRDWQSVDFVEGNGNSFEQQSYSYSHKSPTKGTNYYRLKQIDFDGVFEYSKVVSIDFGNNDGEFFFSPNPGNSGSEITLRVSDQDFEQGDLSLFDLNGKLVLSQKISGTSTVLDISGLSKGIYLAAMQSGRERMMEKLLIK